MKLESLFEEFIGSPDLREELQYCLTQSQVEQFVRFKFGFWLHQRNISNLNIIEVKRIDLVVGIGNEVYFIEFGHLLNLLKHRIESMCEKTINDLTLLDNKIKSLSESGNFLKEKKLYKITISLFTDITIHEKNGKHIAKYSGDKNTGVFIKYGDRISKKYFKDYLIREIESHDASTVSFGKYNETVVKDGELILRWKIGERHEISF